MNLDSSVGVRSDAGSLREVVQKIQSLPTPYHWALADEALLRAIGWGEDMNRGVRGSRLTILLRWGARAGLVWPIIAVVGFVELCRMLIGQLAQGRLRASGAGPSPERFFVGFGAGSEELLREAYAREGTGVLGVVNQISVRSFARWHRVGLAAGVDSLLQALGAARGAIDALPTELARWRLDFVTYIGMRLGYFAFVRAWFRSLKHYPHSGVREVAFLAADTAAFAAVDAGLSTCYLQHGMISYAVLPEFARVEALTHDEAAFMKVNLPNAFVATCPSPRPAFSPGSLTREILVASIYGTADYMANVGALLDWAMERKARVRVRPHPREESTFWLRYERVETVMIERCDDGFHEAVDRLRPRIVVSWFSTVLGEVLDRGIIPVTLCVSDDRNVEGMVYPLFNRCLRFPEDAESLSTLLDDDEFYASMLIRLRSGSSPKVP